LKTAVLICSDRPDRSVMRLIERVRGNDQMVPLAVFAGSEPEGMPAYVQALYCPESDGVGVRIKAALRYVRDSMPECGYVIRLDADSPCNFEDIMRLNKTIVRTRGELVLGKRRLNTELSLKSVMRSAVVRQVFALASGRNIHDTETRIRGFGRELIDTLLHIDGEGYEYEVNVLLYCARNGVPISETKISTPCTESPDSYMQHLRDWIKVYGCVVKFAISSLIAFLIDLFILLGMNRLLDGMHEVAALVISVGTARVISAVVNFYINHFIVFDSNEHVGTAMLKFGLLQIIVLAGNYAIMHVLNILLNMPLAVSKVIADTAMFAVSFVIQGRFIYNK